MNKIQGGDNHLTYRFLFLVIRVKVYACTCVVLVGL